MANYISLLHGGAAFIGGLNGFGSVTPPVLPIPAQDYYLWMGPLTPLIYFVVLTPLAGIIQLGGKLFGGKGAFEDILVVVAFTFWLPVFITMWLFEMPVFVFFPDCRRSALGGLGYLPERLDILRQIAGMLWIVIALTFSVKTAQWISFLKAAALIILAMIPTIAIILTYIR